MAKDVTTLQDLLGYLQENMATKADIASINTELSSVRDDMKSFATKDDIASVRDDMKSFATKDDLNAFATKDDIEEIFSAIKIDLDKTTTKADLKRSEQVILDKVDDKIDDLKGELIVTIRKEDTKLVTLVETLEENKTLNKIKSENILSLEPFPRA